MVQLGGITSANIYRNDDKPLYKRGNRVLIGINVLAISLFLFAKAYYVTKNKIRDKKWKAMTLEVSSRDYFSGGFADLLHRSREIILAIPQIKPVEDWTSDLLTKMLD